MSPNHEVGSRSRGIGRRRAIRSLAGVAGVAGVQGLASALDGSTRDVVPKNKAREAARARVREVSSRAQFSEWAGATVTGGVTFRMKNAGEGPEYLPSAYVFTVRNRGEAVGYVTASARPEWVPILEFSRATPPTDLVESARAGARSAGHAPTGRLLYHGNAKYGLELAGGKAMNVRNGRVQRVRRGVSPDGKSFDGERVERQWSALADGEFAASGDVTATSYWDILWDVPAWTEHDEGNNDYTWIGCGSDTWNDWDGCTPVAGSMVIAYHEGLGEDDDCAREAIIDRLHDYMNTSVDGNTYPWDIDDGFNRYDDRTYDYSGQNIYVWTHPDFTKSEISDHGRPFLCNMSAGGEAWDRNQSYGDHTVTVVGYDYDGDVLVIHDTWDDEIHYLSWGDWTACSYTKVTK